MLSVSIVIPIRDGSQYVASIGEFVARLTVPHEYELREVIVVENGSSDDTYEKLLEQEGVTVLQVAGPGDSYAARNAGVAASSGEIVAFTDADCRPDDDWLIHAVRCLEANNVAAVAGRIVFDLESRPAGAHCWDAFRYMRNDLLTTGRSGAVTANLIIRRAALKVHGPFDEGLLSGADVSWSRRAQQAGMSLQYCPHARVHHRPRSVRELCGKGYRVGAGLGRRARPPRIVVSIFRLLPPRPSTVVRAIEHSQYVVSPGLFVRVFAAAWATRIATAVGVLRARLWG
jgi:cellulose synthase/poly-beta-1,6-N-acetylglucosamine synthase-like glycosyltransferase